MTSVLTRKAYREVTRHRVRSVLIVITIAATVTGLWLFAVPLGLDDAMAQRAAADRLHDIRISPNSLIYSPEGTEPPPPEAIISPSELDGLRALPNVAAVETRPVMRTKLQRGAATEDIWLVGVEDFTDQSVNVVSVDTGTFPSASQVDREALLDWSAGRGSAPGERVAVMAGDAEFYPFTISGAGGTIRWSALAAADGPIVYVPAETVRRFTAGSGFNSIEVRLVDNGPEAARAALVDIRAYLDRVAPEMTYSSIPDVRQPGSWEGKDRISRLVPLLYVIGFAALGAALILVSTTMNTMVSRQTSQIGVMKAIGGSRRAIGWCYLRTVLLLGGIGTALGTAAGALMSDRFGRFVQEDLGGIRATWSTDPWFMLAGITAGLAITVLGSLPALRRARKVTVREALDSHGTGGATGRGTIERLTRRLPLLASTTRMGLRNTVRRRGRSLATSVQVALGIGCVIALGAFAVTALAATQNTMLNESGDLRVYHDRSLMSNDEAQLLATRPDVTAIQPVVYSRVEFGGDERTAWGLPADTVYDYDLSSGRWFTSREVAEAAPVAVIGAPLADMTRTAVGDQIDLGTSKGVRTVEVVGIDEVLVHDGKYVWLPLDTAKQFADQTDPNVYWVETSSPAPDVVDRVAADIHAAFATTGNPVAVDVHYQEMAAARAEDRVVVGVIQVIGLPIVAIGMIGLVSAMTTAVLERTREVGILRAVGARARHVRRVFRTEGTAVAVMGWLIGIPIGYGLGWAIVWAFGRALHTSFTMMFPLWLPLLALAGVIVVARLTLRPPLRQAVRMRVGDALRYE